MSTRNICKFISPSFSDKLEVSKFILEANPEAMQQISLLKSYRIILVSMGEGFFLIDKRKLAFHPGSLIFAMKNESISVTCSQPCEYMYIDFDGMRSEELFLRFHISVNNRSFDGFEGLIPLWRNTLSRTFQETLDLAAESMLLYTFSRLKEYMSTQNDLINRILQLTEERFTDPSLSVGSLSNELNYNAKYVSHQFKQKMNIGYVEYLRDLRMKYAVSLFDHGVDSIKSVSALSGFSDPAYFSTVFKNMMGCSPKDYLALQKKTIQP